MPNTIYYTDTPLSKAIFTFFKHIEEEVVKESVRPGSLKAYIFGGCAMHIHTNARGSADIDVEFSAAKWLTGNEIKIRKQTVTYKNGGADQLLAYDTNFTPMLGPLHEDYVDDAIRLQKRSKESPLWVYVVTPEDLAVSKLGRFGAQDQEDILTLLKMKKMTRDSFYERAKEALKYYVGDVSKTKGYLEYIVKRYNQRYGK